MRQVARRALSTDRLRLEPIGTGHAKGIYEAVASSVPHLLPWLPWAARVTQEDIIELNKRARAQWKTGADFAFAISIDGRVAGVVTLGVSHGGVGELGYWVRADHAGGGVATEASRAVVRFAFGHLGLYRVEARVGVENQRSLRVVEKVGFRLEGTMRNGLDGADGAFDAYMFGLTPADWAELDLASLDPGRRQRLHSARRRRAGQVTGKRMGNRFGSTCGGSE